MSETPKTPRGVDFQRASAYVLAKARRDPHALEIWNAAAAEGRAFRMADALATMIVETADPPLTDPIAQFNLTQVVAVLASMGDVDVVEGR